MQLSYRTLIVFALATLLIPLGSAEATELIFQPDAAAGKDTWVNASSPTTANGTNTQLWFGGDCTGGEQRLYIHFDLSTLAPGSTIDTADLEMYMFSQNGYVVYEYSVFSITEDWNEASLTWDTQPTHEAVAAVTFPGSEWQEGWNDWHSITGLASLVQGWINNPAQNFGMVIQPTSSFYGYAAIWSSDYATASLRPRLVLNGGLVATETSTWSKVKQLYR